MRACRNTPACSGGKEACADPNCNQRGKFRVGKRRPESPRVQNAPWVSKAKGQGGCMASSMAPTPGYVQVLSMVQGQGSELGVPLARVLRHSWGHLKAT